MSLFDTILNTFSFYFKSEMSINIVLYLGRLTWLVYIIGAVIGGRVSFASTDEHDAMDGELVCR